MDLRNTKAYMRGQCLSVDGRIYQLDGEGIVRGVSAADARTLLQGKDWTVVNGKLPPAPVQPVVPLVAPKPVPVPPAPAGLGRSEGNLPAPQMVAQPAEMAAGQAPVPQPSDEPFPAEADQLVGEPPVVAPPFPAEVEQAKPETQPVAEPAVEEDWPAPSEEMSSQYLREMAKAYGVELPHGLKKKAEMVSLIRAARSESENKS